MTEQLSKKVLPAAPAASAPAQKPAVVSPAVAEAAAKALIAALPEKGRQRWSPPAAIRNTDGKVTTADVAAHGYDRDAFQWLRRQDFATDLLWLEFRAGDLRNHAADMLAKADSMDAERMTMLKYGDPAKQKAAARIQKLAASLAALREQLKASGVDVDKLLEA